MADNNELKGLGGWLILVGIGVVVAPFRLLYAYAPMYIPIFSNGTWSSLTTPGSESYTPFLGTLLISEMIFNIGMVVATSYLIYLFFSKHFWFPRVYIGVIVASLIFIPVDAWVVTMIFPDEPVFDPETIKELSRTLISGLIWIPYMLVSKRVKATFVEKMPDKLTPSVIEAGN